MRVHNKISKIRWKTSNTAVKRKLPTLWSRSYYVDTVGCLREDTIKTYIEQQKNESKYFNQKSSHS